MAGSQSLPDGRMVHVLARSLACFCARPRALSLPHDVAIMVAVPGRVVGLGSVLCKHKEELTCHAIGCRRFSRDEAAFPTVLAKKAC